MGSTLGNILMAMVVLFVSIPNSSSGPDGATQALINEICRQTDDFNDCQKSFYADLYNDTIDAAGLTEIALAQTLEYAGETNTFLQNARSHENNLVNRNLYKICMADYEQLITDFDDANSAFAKEDYSSMIVDVEKCERLVDNCQMVLGNKVTELGAKNLHAKVLIKMALVSGKLIPTDGF